MFGSLADHVVCAMSQKRKEEDHGVQLEDGEEVLPEARDVIQRSRGLVHRMREGDDAGDVGDPPWGFQKEETQVCSALVLPRVEIEQSG